MSVSTDKLIYTAKQLRALCAILTRAARQDLENRLKYADADVRALEHAVLRHIQQGSTTLAEISRATMSAPSTLVSVIDNLERKGFLKRGTDPKDRRRTPLELTPQGKVLLEALPDVAHDSSLVTGLSKLSVQERDQLIDTLTHLVHGITEDESLLAWLSVQPQKGENHGG